MLEWYRTHCDYFSLMAECEDLIAEVARTMGHSGDISYQGYNVSLEKPWERLTVAEAFSRHAPVSMSQALEQNIFDEILCTHIEPRLGLEKPVFLHDYPVELGALSRRKKNDPNLAERFEIYLAGLELANGFSELTDHDEQRQRFEKELRMIKKQGRTDRGMPRKFLASLADMPDAAGIALGVDRLAMVMWDKPGIDGVVSFVPEDLK
jgi:lysyl-tRNA synthetase class 2